MLFFWTLRLFALSLHFFATVARVFGFALDKESGWPWGERFELLALLFLLEISFLGVQLSLFFGTGPPCVYVRQRRQRQRAHTRREAKYFPDRQTRLHVYQPESKENLLAQRFSSSPTVLPVGACYPPRRRRHRFRRRRDVAALRRRDPVQFNYPGPLEEILDPAAFAEQLCSCRAIVSTRLHGAILGLHMGVPTLAANPLQAGNKVPDVMIEVMALPDQFLLVDRELTRDVLDREVAGVRRLYEEEGRRGVIHDRLSRIHEDFQAAARHVVRDVVGIGDRPDQQQQQQQQHGEPKQPRLSFGDGAQRPPASEKGGAAGGGGEGASQPLLPAAGSAAGGAPGRVPPSSSPGTPSPAAARNEYLVAAWLLVAIVGLAALPSTAGAVGSRQGPSESVAAKDAPPGPASAEVSSASFGRPRGQRAVTGTTSVRGESSPADLERRGGVPPKEDQEPPSAAPLSRRNRRAPASSAPLLLFLLNFALWIALAVGFSAYSKRYLRDTHDPVGLLALQGISGSVVLFALGRSGLGASAGGGGSGGGGGGGGSGGLPGGPGLTSGPPGPKGRLMQLGSGRETLAAVLHTAQALLTNISLFVGGVRVVLDVVRV